VHSWSGPHGVPGDLERWEHGSYRWRRALEATAVMIAIILLAPWSVEIVAGACLMALGLLMLVWRVMPRRSAPSLRRALALLLAVLALVEARKWRVNHELD
jgi:hypothetical protein